MIDIIQAGEIRLSGEKARVLSQMIRDYDTWRSVRLRTGHGHLQWKAPRGTKQYLYRLDGHGKGRSLGPRDEVTEKIFVDWQAARLEMQQVEPRLDANAGAYRALGLPQAQGPGMYLLRMLDIAGWGDTVLVAGTLAMTAYAAAIGGDEEIDPILLRTRNLNLIWRNEPPLREVESEITHLLRHNLHAITADRRHARMRSPTGEEVRVMIGAAPAMYWPKDAQQRPIVLPTVAWLNHGTSIASVVASNTAYPVRIVAPDPRSYVAHKVWLSEKTERTGPRRDRDLAQAKFVARVVLPYLGKTYAPLDPEYLESMPEDMRHFYESQVMRRHVLDEYARSTAVPAPMAVYAP